MKDSCVPLATGQRAGLSPLRRNVTLGLLMLVMAVSYIDRFMLAVLIEPIKREMVLSDTTIGLLTGFAFSLIYALCSLPMARLSDSGHRRRTLSIAILLWSMVTAATGLCSNAWQLCLARFGVGIGESGAIPTSHAIIVESYPVSQRATALAIFSVGGPLGMLIAFGGGGLLESTIGWRLTFATIGTLGMLLSLIIRLGLPADRQHRRAADHAPVPRVSLRQMLSSVPFLHMLMGYALSVLLLFGQSQWIAPYFQRSFGQADLGHLGPLIASTRMTAMIAGLVVGGFLSDRLSRGRTPVSILFISCSYAISFVPQIASYLTTNLTLALACSAAAGFASSLAGGPAAASILALASAKARASASAMGLMASAIVGMGIGPLAIGMMSDHLATAYGNESLRYALLATNIIVTPWMLIHFLLARNGARRLTETDQ